MLCISIYGQQDGKLIMDSLRGKSFEYLQEKCDEEENGENSKIYSNAYLKKAKTEGNWKEQMNAYKIILHQSDKKQRIYYSDSMILAAKHTRQNDLIGAAYLTKGIVYYDLQNLTSALDNYLIADGLISDTEDLYLKHKVKYNIAQIKYYLGFYDEAIALFQENIRYFKAEDEDIPYLTSLHSLALCYNRLGKLDLCSQSNSQGIDEATELEYYNAIPRFINAEGINQFFKKNYTVSIAKLQETLPAFLRSNDFTGETVTYFYLGKNYWMLKQSEKAIPFFKKVSEAFIEKNFTNPDLRESFEILIDYYKSKNDYTNQLKYIDQLLLADKYLNNNYKYLSGRIHKEYDTKKLILAKDEIEDALRFQKEQNIIYIALIFILVLGLGYMIRKSRENKRRFK